MERGSGQLLRRHDVDERGHQVVFVRAMVMLAAKVDASVVDEDVHAAQLTVCLWVEPSSG